MQLSNEELLPDLILNSSIVSLYISAELYPNSCCSCFIISETLSAPNLKIDLLTLFLQSKKKKKDIIKTILGSYRCLTRLTLIQTFSLFSARIE